MKNTKQASKYCTLALALHKCNNDTDKIQFIKKLPYQILFEIFISFFEAVLPNYSIFTVVK